MIRCPTYNRFNETQLQKEAQESGTIWRPLWIGGDGGVWALRYFTQEWPPLAVTVTRAAATTGARLRLKAFRIREIRSLTRI